MSGVARQPWGNWGRPPIPILVGIRPVLGFEPFSGPASVESLQLSSQQGARAGTAPPDRYVRNVMRSLLELKDQFLCWLEYIINTTFTYNKYGITNSMHMLYSI